MLITYNEDRQRFEAQTSYAERFACNATLKAAGFSFDGDLKIWNTQSYIQFKQKPRTWEEQVRVAMKLAQYLDAPAQARIASTAQHIAEQAKAEQALAAESLETSRATDADVDLPRPEGLNYLPYQKAGIAYAMKRQNTLIADEMGLGKTIQAIGVSNTDTAAKRVLLIVPAKLKLNWAKEFVKWDVKNLQVGVITKNTKKTRAAIERWGKGRVTIISAKGPFTTDVVIANYDILARGLSEELRKTEWDIMVADECHKVKNGRALRTRHLLGGKEKTDKQTGKVTAEAVEPISAKRNIFLTGTPIVNRPKELFPMLERFDPTGLGKSFFKFAQRYCGAEHNGYGWDFNGSSNLDELQDKLRSTFMVRRLKADVLKDLPPKRRQIVTLEAPDSMDEILQREVALYDKLNHKSLDIPSVPFAEISALRQEIADNKVPFVIDYVEDALESLDKVVVFAHHDSVIRAIAKHFGDAAVFANGTCSDIEVQDAAERFQTDPTCRVFVGSIIAAGVGITLTAASTVIFAELDWVPGNVTQAEDRCHRIGQTDSVNIYHLVLDGSLDARMVEILIEKQEVIDNALDTQHAAKPMPTVGAPAPAQLKTPVVGLPEADALPVETVRAIHQSLQYLSSVCDGAIEEDGHGFNGNDSVFGKSLAAAPILTPRQAKAGQRLVRKYQKQIAKALGPQILVTAGVTKQETA